VSAFTIARFTLNEALTRRLILAGLLLSLAFIALYTAAFAFIYGRTLADFSRRGASDRTSLLIAGYLLTTLGLYAVHFLSSFIALFLAVGAVSSEIDSGTLHAVLARPISRAEFLLGRWLGLAIMITVYVGAMSGLLLAISRLIAGYQAPDAARAIALMILSGVLLLSLCLLGSTLFSTLANGVIAFSLFGLAWLAGIVEYVGSFLANEALVNLGIAVSLLVPSDGLWRAASYYVQSPGLLSALGTRGSLPFASFTPPATPFLLWAAAYTLLCVGTSVLAFTRRDL
jgi:ABC-type transport system involved in multi-copper enzyme maturation permease subunit